MIASVIILAGVGFLAFQRSQRNKETDIKRTKRMIGAHIILPQDEEPVLATITDNAKLESDFLKRGQNGDRVLIYSKAKKVIIYRPSVDRVVEVGPVSIVPLNEGQKTE